MKTKHSLLVTALVLGAGMFLVSSAQANDGCCGASSGTSSIATVASTPFNLATAKEAYPLDTCVVSGEKLEGDMGGPVDYVHKEEGKPDRLVRFCCKGCIKDFKKDPVKFLKKIDDAPAAKAGQPKHHM